MILLSQLYIVCDACRVCIICRKTLFSLFSVERSLLDLFDNMFDKKLNNMFLALPLSSSYQGTGCILVIMFV